MLWDATLTQCAKLPAGMCKEFRHRAGSRLSAAGRAAGATAARRFGGGGSFSRGSHRPGTLCYP